MGPVSPFGQNDVCVWFKEAQIFRQSRESEVADAEIDERPIVVEAEMHHEVEDENATAVQAETHNESEVADAEKDESLIVSRPIVVEADKYYAVDYVDRFYIGRVVQNSTKEGFYQMKFLHRCAKDGEPWFSWPRTDDIDDVHTSVIFFGPITLEGCADFRVPDIKRIQSCFNQI